MSANKCDHDDDDAHLLRAMQDYAEFEKLSKEKLNAFLQENGVDDPDAAVKRMQQRLQKEKAFAVSREKYGEGSA